MFRTLLCALVVVAGCESNSYSQDEATQSTVGRSGDLVLRHWGPPTREATLSDGSRVWEFESSTEELVYAGNTHSQHCNNPRSTSQGTFTPYGNGIDYQGTTTYSQNCLNYADGIVMQPVTRSCTIRLIVGPDNIVRNAENFGDC
jgi:hypothetical protein